MVEQPTGQKKGKKFTISAPKARVGDIVHVLNYRMRPPVWVDGKVVYVAAKESWFSPGFKWAYDVSVQSVHWSGAGRRSYTVSVRDSDIRAVTP